MLNLQVTANEALARLMVVIAAENLAVGFASAAIVVYLSSIVNKKYAAVQYALLASLSFLLGDKRLSGVPVHLGSFWLRREAEPTSLRAPRGPSGRAGGGTEA